MLLDPLGEPALFGEALPEPHEGAVEYLRDATLTQAEGPAYLLQREAFVVVEGGDHPLLLTQILYGPHQPRANLGELRRHAFLYRIKVEASLQLVKSARSLLGDPASLRRLGERRPENGVGVETAEA